MRSQKHLELLFEVGDGRVSLEQAKHHHVWVVGPWRGQQPHFLLGVAIISQVEQGLNQVVAAPGGHILVVIVHGAGTCEEPAVLICFRCSLYQLPISSRLELLDLLPVLNMDSLGRISTGEPLLEQVSAENCQTRRTNFNLYRCHL